MKIKKYAAPTLREAVEKMKKELGSDAVILNARRVNAGSASPNKRYFEVVATREEDRLVHTPKEKREAREGAPKESEQIPSEETRRAERNAPEETRRAERNAPEETRRAERNAPEETRRAERNAPEETRRAERNAPEETRRAERNAPEETRRAERNAPEETRRAERNAPEETRRAERNAPEETRRAESRRTPDPRDEIPAKDRRYVPAPERAPEPEPPPEEELPEAGDDDVDAELDRLRERILRTYRNEAPEESEPEPKPDPPKRAAAPREKTLREKPAGVENLRKRLLDQDVLPDVADRVVDQVAEQAPFIKAGELDQFVVSVIASMIRTEPFSVKKRKKGKTIAIVGPTGVGKTTIIAKLAVVSKILHKLDVGLITLDTYRLGALDQLKVFSEISGVDFLVAYEPKDVPKQLAKFKKKDIVFLDTAGRSQNNQKLLIDTQRFLDHVSADETLLALSATSGAQHVIDAATKFSQLGYNGVIVTKLDEAATFGGMLNYADKFDPPIKFLTNGQVIPDDVIAADADFIANLVYSGELM